MIMRGKRWSSRGIRTPDPTMPLWCSTKLSYDNHTVMPQKNYARESKRPAVTVNDLASPPESETDRFFLFERYCKQKPTPDAIPYLRRALADSYHAVVKCAAESLRKLGPAAQEAMPDLLAVAARVDDATGVPQAYPECVEAM